MGPLTSKEKKRIHLQRTLRHLWWKSWKEQIVERGGRGYIEHVASLLIGSPRQFGSRKIDSPQNPSLPHPHPHPHSRK